MVRSTNGSIWNAWSLIKSYELLDKLEDIAVYLDDIRIFSHRMHYHVKHLRAVCEVLRKEQLYARLSKYGFRRRSTRRTERRMLLSQRSKRRHVARSC